MPATPTHIYVHERTETTACSQRSKIISRLAKLSGHNTEYDPMNIVMVSDELEEGSVSAVSRVFTPRISVHGSRLRPPTPREKSRETADWVYPLGNSFFNFGAYVSRNLSPVAPWPIANFEYTP